MTNKTIGKYGENLAKEFLIKKGYKILETNYHFSKIAEIDIIALKNNIIHFVEVKTRTQKNFGSPLEAITRKKLSQIFTCANYYLLNSKKNYERMQIDAISILLNKDKTFEINYIENITL